MNTTQFILGAGVVGTGLAAYNVYQAASNLTYLPVVSRIGWENDGPVLYVSVLVNNSSRTSFTIHKPGLALIINGQTVAKAQKGIERITIRHNSRSVIENLKINFSLVQAAIAAVPILSNLVYGRPVSGTTVKLQVTTDVFAELFSLPIFSIPVSVTVDLLEAMNTSVNGLGFVVAEKRHIENGSQFDRFFPEPKNSYTIIKPDGSVEDTIGLMAGVIEKWQQDTAAISRILQGETVQETCENIWDFCTTYLHYKPDTKGTEELRSPKRSWYDGQVLYREQQAAGIPENQCSGVDCDCFSIFVGTILKNLGIPFSIRITSYGKGWQHVYVVVPFKGSELIIDPVYHQFNREKKYEDQISINGQKLKDMKIAVLNGTGFSFEDLTSGFTLAEVRRWEIEHLIQLRNEAVQYPDRVLAYGYHPALFIQCLDYLIEYWNTTNRRKAIEYVEKALKEHNPYAGQPVLNGTYSGLHGDPSFWVELGKGVIDFFVNLFSKKEATEQDIANIRNLAASTASQVSAFFINLFKDPTLDLDKIMAAHKEAQAIRGKMDGSVWDFLGKFKVANETSFYNEMLGQVDSYFNQLYAFIEQLFANAATATNQVAAVVKDILTNGESPSKLGEAKRLYATLKISMGKTGDTYMRNAMLLGKGKNPKDIKFAEGQSPEQAFASDPVLPGLLQRILAAEQIGSPDIPPLPTFTATVYTGGSSGSGGSGGSSGSSVITTGRGGESGGSSVIIDTEQGGDLPLPTKASMTTPMIVIGILAAAGIGYSIWQASQKKGKQSHSTSARGEALSGTKRKTNKGNKKKGKAKKPAQKIPIVHLM